MNDRFIPIVWFCILFVGWSCYQIFLQHIYAYIDIRRYQPFKSQVFSSREDIFVQSDNVTVPYDHRALCSSKDQQTLTISILVWQSLDCFLIWRLPSENARITRIYKVKVFFGDSQVLTDVRAMYVSASQVVGA